MIQKKDIERLRKTATDDAVFDYAYKQDSAFRDAVDRTRPALDSAGPLIKNRFNSAILNRHYFGSWELKKADPLTAQMATSATESMQKKQQSKLGYIGETISNIPGSALQLGKDVLTAGANVFNPDPSKNTVVNLGKAGMGAGINALETVTGNEEMFDNPFGSEELASQIGQFYMDRYGSIDNAAETLKQDPIGFAADIATLFSGAGAALKGAGAVSKVAGLSKAGKLATKAGRAIDPLTYAGKMTAGTAQIAGEMLSPGKAAEKLVTSSLGITKGDAAVVADQAGKSAGRVVLDQGAVGPFGTTAKKIGDQMQQSAKTSKATKEAGLAGIPRTFPNDIPAINAALAELQDFYSGTRGNDDIIAKINGLAKQPTLTLTDLDEIRAMLGDTEQLYRRSGDIKAGAKAEGLAAIYDRLKTSIEETAKQEGFPDVKALNKNTQVSTELSQSIKKGIDGGAKNSVTRLTDYLAGTLGGAIGGLPGTIVGVGANRILGSQRFKTALAFYLNKLSAQELQKLEKAITRNNFSKDAKKILKKVIDQAKKDASRVGAEAISIPERSE